MRNRCFRAWTGHVFEPSENASGIFVPRRNGSVFDDERWRMAPDLSARNSTELLVRLQLASSSVHEDHVNSPARRKPAKPIHKAAWRFGPSIVDAGIS